MKHMSLRRPRGGQIVSTLPTTLPSLEETIGFEVDERPMAD
jgi:hypothetical protein